MTPGYTSSRAVHLVFAGWATATMALACAPAPDAPLEAPANTSPANTPSAPAPSSAEPPSPEIRTARITAEIGDTRFYDIDADTVTIEQGERLLAVRHRKDVRKVELTAMAPGQARLVARGVDGPLQVIVDIPDSPHNPCKLVKRVPVNGLVAVEAAREYRHVASPAGKLHVMSVGSAVSFDGPGTLLLMTSDHDGVRRCTRFEADDPGSCEASIVLPVGTTTNMTLPNTSRVLLHEEHVTERWENNNETLVLEGRIPGVATLWVRHDATGWRCTAIQVSPR